MVFLTRRERFSAAHRMFRQEWSDDENYKIFGKCSNPNWHGHNYVLYVTVKGNPSNETGFVISMDILKKIIKEKVIDKVDHKNLNLEVEFMRGRVTTTENLAVAIWNELKGEIESHGVWLHRVRIEETENNKVDYYGEKN